MLRLMQLQQIQQNAGLASWAQSSYRASSAGTSFWVCLTEALGRQTDCSIKLRLQRYKLVWNDGTKRCI